MRRPFFAFLFRRPLFFPQPALSPLFVYPLQCAAAAYNACIPIIYARATILYIETDE